MDAQELRKRSRLNPDEYRVKALAKSYHIDPMVIAYIRSAILSGSYTVETLIEHIKADNIKRTDALDYFMQKQELTEQEEKIKKSTERNFELRDKALKVLTESSKLVLGDILT